MPAPTAMEVAGPAMAMAHTAAACSPRGGVYVPAAPAHNASFHVRHPVGTLPPAAVCDEQDLVGPARYCSPRQQMPVNPINEGSMCIG